MSDVRTNTTPVAALHPGDHNDIVAELNDLDDTLETWMEASPFRVYDTIAERDATSTVGVPEGQLAWCASERNLSVWRDTWLILREPYRPWSPAVYLADTPVAVRTPPARESGYRYDFGVVQFNLSIQIGPLRPADYPPADALIVTPPIPYIPASGLGIAGPGYAVSSSVGGALGVGTLYDDTPRLAILKPPTGLLAFWDFMGEIEEPDPDDPPDPDKGTVEKVDIYMSGSYLTTAYGTSP